MKSAAQLGGRTSDYPCRSRRRPCLEYLEARQPVSDTLLGGLMTLSFLEPGLTFLDSNALKTDIGKHDLLPADQLQPLSIKSADSQADFRRSFGPFLRSATWDEAQPQIGYRHWQGGAAGWSDRAALTLGGNESGPAGGWALRAEPWISHGSVATTAIAPPTPGAVRADSSVANENSNGFLQLTGPLLKDGASAQAHVVGVPGVLDAPAAAATTGPTSASRVPPSGSLEHPIAAGAPLRFEANQGQFDAPVHFLARGPGYTLSLAPDQAVISLRRSTESDLGTSDGTHAAGQSVLRMQLVGANSDPQMVGLHPLPGIVNYFMGNDPSRWHTGIPTYSQVLYRNVYDGVDQVYYGNQGQLEYDFVLAPGANPSAIRLGFAGADRLEINRQGDLVVHAAAADIVLHKPVLYQEVGGASVAPRQPVAGSFVLQEAQQVGFAVGAYDPGKTLVIDPSINYTTIFANSQDDEGFGIAVDSDGSAYATGFTTAPAGDRDVFVAKVDNNGSPVYTTYLGGSQQDQGLGIAVDARGRAVVTGFTRGDFPITPNALQTTLQGPSDAFVTQLDESGTQLLYSSYLGGPGDEEGRGIAVATDLSTGQTLAYVTGITTSQTDFPTRNAAQPNYGGGNSDAFVTKIRIDPDPQQTRYDYSTYQGGIGDEDVFLQHESGGIAIDRAGNAYTTGATTSPNFPTTQNAFQPVRRGATDAFVTIYDPNGRMVYSTYLGGPGPDHGRDLPANEGNGIGVSDAGHVYVTGETSSVQFWRTPDAFQPQLGGPGAVNAFLTRLNPLLPPPQQLIYSTYLGGSAVDIAFGISVTPPGAAYLAGATTSNNFPTANPLQPYPGGDLNAFVAKFNSRSSISYSTYVGVTGLRSLDRAVAWGYVQPGADRRSNGSWPASFSKVSGFCGRDDSQSVPVSGSFGNWPYGGGPGPADIPCTDANTAGSQGVVTPTQINVTQIDDCPCALTIDTAVRMGTSVQLTWGDSCPDYTTTITIYWMGPDGVVHDQTLDCGTAGCDNNATVDNIQPGTDFWLVAASNCCVTYESGHRTVS